MLSDNAEPFYSFRINRTLPLYIPLVSRLLGPMRYDNFFGKLSGHMYPRQPYFYGQKINFAPTRNLELGFSRDAVIAGEGSTPLTFGNFWNSFTSTSSGTYTHAVRDVVGARHGSFDFRYRLPGLRNWLTLYADSVVHDDISPVDAPRRAATTSGIYLSKFPLISKLDLHVEGGSTDIPARARGGQFYYWEGIYRDCYLNKGNLMGSWLGREGTGGQAWSTYWFNAQSTLELGYRTLRVSPFFVPHGESQQAAYGELRYRWRDGLALQFRLQAERWAAPALAASPQMDVSTQFQVSFSPKKWQLPLRKASTVSVLKEGHY
jgi:Capsule assembly protein Wzi